MDGDIYNIKENTRFIIFYWSVCKVYPWHKVITLDYSKEDMQVYTRYQGQKFGIQYIKYNFGVLLCGYRFWGVVGTRELSRSYFC